MAPDLFCSDKLDAATTTVTITGSGFAALPTKTLEGGVTLFLPQVGLHPSQTFGGAASDVTISGDPAGANAGLLHFVSDTQLKLDLAKGLLAPGVYDVTVTNPDGVAAATLLGALVIVPPPELKGFDKAVNALACLAEGDQKRTLTGQWFAKIDNKLPTVNVTPGSPIPADGVDGCVTVAANITQKIELCTSVSFTLKKGSLMPGEYDVSVTNPAPVDCSSSKSLRMAIVPPPAITELKPPSICDDGSDKTVDILGTNLLTVNAPGMGALPTVTLTINGMSSTVMLAMNSPDPADCTDLVKDIPGAAVKACTRLSILVPKEDKFGDYDVTVKNPEPVACSATAPKKLSIAPVPTISDVTSGTPPGVKPPKLCSGGGQLNITGTGFYVDSNMTPPKVTLVPEGGGPSVGAMMVTCTDCMPGMQGTALTATIPPLTPGKSYDVTVTNPGGCATKMPFVSVFVDVGPVLFMVDPGTVPNEVNTVITLFATKLTQPLPMNAVVITPNPNPNNVMPTTLVTLPIDMNFPKRVQAIVPKGQPAGTYDVSLTDGGTCPATTITKGLTVVAPPEKLFIASVTPPFGADNLNVSITIKRDAAMSGMVSFLATPRVYLNPSGNAMANSILLKATTFIDKDTLTAVVPAGTADGTYDVLVVNPDPTAEVGLAKAVYKVVAPNAAPPVITAAVPPSVVQAAGQVVEVDGTDFRANCKVSATCTGNKMPPVTNGACTCTMGTKGCTTVATIDATTLAIGDVCILRVTNADMTFGDFSAIGVTGPSLNLQSPTFGTNLNVARRGLGSAAAKPNNASRFVYAIAGDDGTDANAFNDVESAPVDIFGAMGVWTKQKNGLLQKRAFFGTAQSPHYAYVVGGTKGATNADALASAERAQVLDPLEAPVVYDLDFQFIDKMMMNPPPGLGGGEWIYRVSAELSAGDVSNPAGEGLPSDEFVLKIPMGSTLIATIFWKAPVDCAGNALPNVTKYHVYRTPAANAGSGSEQLVAIVNAPTLNFTDDGSAMPDATKKPLPLGSTGVWHALPGLGAGNERNGGSAAVAVDNVTPATTLYLYAIAGKNAAGTALGSYQFLKLTADACGHETPAAAWTTGANALPTPRERHMTWYVDRSVVTGLGPKQFIYTGGGRDGAGAQVSTVFLATVGNSGDLGTWSPTVKGFGGGGVTGAGVFSAASQLFSMGGAQGAGFGVNNKGVSAIITDTNGTLANNSWNAGLNLLTPRAFMGSSVQSAFAFFVGGSDGTNALKTTETVIW